MLSYRHSFHAGNHADILKHVVLVGLLRHFLRKDKPFTYIDSHAGAGWYEVGSEQARKTGENAGGIGALWPHQPDEPLLADYLARVRACNDEGQLNHYPGSPAIAMQLLRSADRACLIELHNAEIEVLREHFRGDSRVAVHHRDACEGLLALTPPTPRRGLALIDPAYEILDDYEDVERTVHELHQKWPIATLALWYPLLAQNRDRSGKLKRGLACGNISNLLCVELAVGDQQEDYGMHGSGLLIVNAPWQFDEQLHTTLGALAPLLCRPAAAGARVQWLLEPA